MFGGAFSAALTATLVEFPKLGLKFNVDPSITVFGRDIYWYGIIICVGMLISIFLGLRFSERYALDKDKILDYVICAVPSAIVGARLYYVIFSWSDYKDNFWDVFKIWEGGLAIYGGIFGALLAIFIMSRFKKDKFFHLIDFAIPYIMLGQAIGRWGNFMNQEAFGTNTNLLWGMISPKTTEYLTWLAESTGAAVDPLKPVHPTFLYESLICLAGFIFLVIYRSKLQKNYGEVTALYMCIYGVARALIEGLRTDSLMVKIGSVDIRVSQVLSVALIVLGIALYIDSRLKGQKAVLLVKNKEGILVPRDGEADDEEDDAPSSLAEVIEAMAEEETGKVTDESQEN